MSEDRLMQVKGIAECSKGSSLQYIWPSVIKIFILSIFEWLFYKGFTVLKIIVLGMFGYIFLIKKYSVWSTVGY